MRIQVFNSLFISTDYKWSRTQNMLKRIVAAVTFIVFLIAATGFSVFAEESDILTDLEKRPETEAEYEDQQVVPNITGAEVLIREKTEEQEEPEPVEKTMAKGSLMSKGGELVESGICGEGVTYELYSDGSLIIGGTGSMYDYSSQDQVPWYQYQEDITSVLIGDGVTGIGSYAFCGCSSLESIDLPSGIDYIGRNAFERCGALSSIDIPTGVETLQYDTFRDCIGLTEISIPSTVRYIEGMVFYNCTSLRDITIPEGVIDIGGSAFYGCTSLREIEIPSTATSLEGGLFTNCTSLVRVSLPENLSEIKQSMFFGCSSLTGIVIPSTVTKIGESAFSDCISISYLTIPEGVKTIEGYAFSGSGITGISLPGTLTSLQYSVFEDCTSLKTVTLPDSIRTLKQSLFYGCTSLESVVLPNSITTIPNAAFRRCTSLTTIELPETVTTISEYAFTECSSLKEINLPSGLTTIQDMAFYDCTALESIEIPAGVTGLGASVFYNCRSLKTVLLPETLTRVSYMAFSGCSAMEKLRCHYDCLTNVTQNAMASLKELEILGSPTSFTGLRNFNALEKVNIPDSVTSIGANAFNNCWSLESVDLPEGVVNIYNNAFYNCYGLKRITIPEGVTTVGQNAFYNCNSLEYIKAPYRYKATILDQISHSNLKTVIFTGEFDETIGFSKGEFKDCTLLESFTIPSGIEKIEEELFSGCVSLHEISGFENVVYIGKDAFKGTKITSFPYGSDIYFVSGSAFLEDDSFDGIYPSYLNHENDGDGDGIIDYHLSSGITLDYSEIQLEPYKTQKLVAEVTPASAGGNIVWSSSDPSVASVSQNGLVNAIREGTTIITATTKDGAHKATCIVRVGVVVRIILNQPELTLQPGLEATVSASIIPDTLPDKTLIWTSSDETVATVDENGHITAVAGGIAVITATLRSGEASATCTVRVQVGSTFIKNASNTGEGVALEWYPVDHVNKYAVKRKTGTGEWNLIGLTEEISFTDTTVKAGVEYSYIVVCTNSDGTVEISPESMEKTIVFNPFRDVATTESYFKYVMWAYNNGVVAGTSNTTFAPNGECTRGQLAVMLYRMFGKPSVSGKTIPFTDVKENAYYYKAIVWAYNKGYIKGISGTSRFNPDGSITRGDMVVILYRICKDIRPEECDYDIANPFKDVKESDYYFKAVMWAYKKGITKGTTSTTFSPKKNCLRSQLAVFLNKFNNITHIIE